jgi:hypothetical protein
VWDEAITYHDVNGIIVTGVAQSIVAAFGAGCGGVRECLCPSTALGCAVEGRGAGRAGCYPSLMMSAAGRLGGYWLIMVA